MGTDRGGGRAAQLFPAACAVVAGLLLQAPSVEAGWKTVAVGDLVTISHESGSFVEGAEGRSLSVELLAVLSDERCPAETMCAWAKPPVVSLRLTTRALERDVQLQIGFGQRAATFEGWSVQGLDLLPRPRRTESFGRVRPFDDYSLIVSVTQQ